MSVGRYFLHIILGCALLLQWGCSVQPVPLSLKKINQSAKQAQLQRSKGQEPIIGALTLSEVMARVLKYNLDHRVQMMNVALQQRILDLSATDLWPKLAINSGFGRRSNTAASKGARSTTASSSQDKTSFDADLALSWSILDFSVSYFQARQNGDRFFIAMEQRRKAVHNLLAEVRFVFWQALSAQKLRPELQRTLTLARSMLDNLGTIEQEQHLPPLEILTLRQSLLKSIQQLETLHKEMSDAMVRLNTLLNLPPTYNVPLQDLEAYPVELPRLKRSLMDMEAIALNNRPEFRESLYEERIQWVEAQKRILQLFPGVSFQLDGNFDHNLYLVNQNWASASMQLSGYLLKILTLPWQQRQNQAQISAIKAARQALTMAIVSQIYLAMRQYNHMRHQYQQEHQLKEVAVNILQNHEHKLKHHTGSHIDMVKSAIAALIQRYRYYQTMATMQNALGDLVSSLGVDLLPSTSWNRRPVNMLAKMIHHRLGSWYTRLFHDRKKPQQRDPLRYIVHNVREHSPEISQPHFDSNQLNQQLFTGPIPLAKSVAASFHAMQKNRQLQLAEQKRMQALMRYRVVKRKLTE
ncbi:TolC family protein [Magnetococcales bacterium HHB-1]